MSFAVKGGGSRVATIEMLLDRSDESSVEESNAIGSSDGSRVEIVSFDAKKVLLKPLANGHTTLIRNGHAKSDSSEMTSLRQYSGGRGAYGVLGMQRNDPRNRLRQEAGFSTTHSVYSFFLLNVRETLRHGVLYPAKRIWEDIEVSIG
jgi:hypothetical protein